MAVLDSRALNTDPDGLAFLADVLGTSGVGRAADRRFPVEAWNPALRVRERVLFGTSEPNAGELERVPAHAE